MRRRIIYRRLILCIRKGNVLIPAVLIAKKRDHRRLSAAEINDFVIGFTEGKVTDYQMAAMAMAICLNGMQPDEISALTRAMLESGDRLPRREFDLPRVDKHSTGGLGDKVSLVLAPLLACCDVAVPMISGRGLGLSGGTLDKLEAIPGFQCDLSTEQASRVLTDVGAHIISASKRIAPADRKLYALRDVTGTVESIALITASILSKKLAASLDALVMDVKVGSGAFMKSLDEALNLSKSLVATGAEMDLPVTALVTDMDQPLGEAIGNSNEVNEAIEVMQGGGPGDVRELTIQLCSEPLMAAGVCDTIQQATTRLASKLDDGSAWGKFQEMVAAQDGQLTVPLPVAKRQAVIARQSGYLESIRCTVLGECVVALGGGRRRKEDQIDPRVGIDVCCKIGDETQAGQVLAYILSDQDVGEWASRVADAFVVSQDEVARRPLVIERLGGSVG